MTLRDNPSGPRTPAWVLVGAPPPHQRAPRPSLDPDRWLKRCRLAVISLGVLTTVLVATAIAVRVAHPRDEAAFLRQIDQARPMVDLNDDDLVLEGVYACQWLDRRDRAILRHGGRWDRDALIGEYLSETRPSRPGGWGRPTTWPDSRGVVADAAWSQLCGGTWWWHRPHAGGGQSFGGGDDSD